MLAPSEGVMKKIFNPDAMKKTAKKAEVKDKNVKPSKFTVKK